MNLFDHHTDADSNRDTVCNALLVSIDLAATFIEAASRSVPDHMVERCSLVPWVNEETPVWRDYVIFEYDFSVRSVAVKLMHWAAPGLRPMLCDLQTNPEERIDPP